MWVDDCSAALLVVGAGVIGLGLKRARTMFVAGSTPDTQYGADMTNRYEGKGTLVRLARWIWVRVILKSL